MFTHQMRAVNHFFNPFWDQPAIYPYCTDGTTNGLSWCAQRGGLYDYVPVSGFWIGKPSPEWGQAFNPFFQNQPQSNFTDDRENYFTWEYAKKYYYAALTGDSTNLLDEMGNPISGVTITNNMSEDDRNYCFALTFRAVGQVMHLIEDSGQPERARNQAHPLSDQGFWGLWDFGFEHYAMYKYNFLGTAANNISWQRIVGSDPTPIRTFCAQDLHLLHFFRTPAPGWQSFRATIFSHTVRFIIIM